MNFSELDKRSFSVVIPVYNRENTVRRAIESVLRQTYEDFEVIVVDDGSTDGTKAVVNTITDNRLRYVYQANQGAQVARNVGLRMACGTYISFLDSDDEWLPDFLSEVKSEFEQKPSVSCVYCLSGRKDESGEIALLRQDHIEGDIYKAALEQGYLTSPTFLAVKRSCFDEIGEWDVNFAACQDDDICFRLAKKFRFALIPKILALVHTSYEGCNNRIGASAIRVTNAWWQLWHKYEKDVLTYCGQRTMAKHYLECACRFAQAGNIEMQDEAYESAVGFFDYQTFWEEYYKHFSGERLYCYGAGAYATNIGSFLLKKGIAISAFVVTDGQMKADNLFGVPILYLSEVEDDERCNILLAVSAKHYEALRAELSKKSIKNIYYLDEDLYLWMCFMTSRVRR